ncbi:unnamed protein product [Heligmosomoides polygyrus]|uniref:Recep_L_domain domain-containing protein n=1 Tax=Heligmosomoides polygyrus TaxID=6339 RepID=A0A183GDL7_HELPZ|nr:unnamed protein product [Heligmosomoides polygyrus]
MQEYSKGVSSDFLNPLQCDLKDHPCNFPPPQNAKCRNFYGRINVGEADSKQLDKVELLRGSIQLTRSNITEFPLLRNLKTLEQVDSFPVITIRQNPKLIGVEPLYNVDLKTNNESTAVVLEDNPLLCYNKRQANQPFVAKFMKGVKQCGLFCSGSGRAAIRHRPLNDPPPYRLTVVSVDIENGYWIRATAHGLAEEEEPPPSASAEFG